MHDNTTIEVTVVTGSKEDAKTVAAAARAALRSAMNSLVYDDPRTEGYYLYGSQYSDRGVQYDPESGNYFVVLTYTIETQA